MRIAVQRRRRRNGDDNGANYFEWLRSTAWRQLRQVPAQGAAGRPHRHLNRNEWNAEDGSSRQRVEIIADNVMFLDGPKSDEADSDEAVPAGVGAEDDIAF